MELVNTIVTIDENSFDPTPKLKSSPIPILFVSFNKEDQECFNCGDKYTRTLFYGQKYCKNCLSRYITEITDNDIYLDVCIYTMNLECSEHEMSRDKELLIQNIQEWCKNCSGISYFKQILARSYNYNSRSIHDDNEKDIINKMFESEKDCKLCGKLVNQQQDNQNNEVLKFKVCSNCYQVSSGRIESTLTKQPSPILYLPWWDNENSCITCNSTLKFTSDCQKYCTKCCIIYIGCRYCLTTNIIFGFTDQSQCKKCKRMLFITIDIANISCGNRDLDDFLYDPSIYGILRIDENISKNNPTEIYDNINRTYKSTRPESIMEWIPYSQITNMKQIAEGRFGIIYQATWLDGILDKTGFRMRNQVVIIKRFKDSQNISKDFLNKLKSNQYCFKFKHHVIRYYGFTKDPELNDYMLVMQYASEGDLYNYLQKKFTQITWNKEKLRMLYQISDGLETIHKANFIHQNFHSGNILFDLSNGKRYQCQIGDLGLSGPANDTSSNNEIYGVIPYIAPEIFKGSAFSKESDIYSFGMIMWEFTTGCKPFANVEHDHTLIYQIIDGKRPEITDDTPKCFANLMKSCWDPDPKKRPSIMEIRKTFYQWFQRNKDSEQFQQAEIKRFELLNSKKLGPEFPEKPHSKAIYTSRPLRSLISNSSSVNSFSTISFDRKQDYISKDQGFEIDTRSSSVPNLSTNQHPDAVYTSRPISALISAAILRKRSIEESNDETNVKYIKAIKIDDDSSSGYKKK